MAYGPDKALPAGESKKNLLKIVEEKIDEIISTREGPTIVINEYQVNYIHMFQKELTEMYTKAGWYEVSFEEDGYYWIMKLNNKKGRQDG